MRRKQNVSVFSINNNTSIKSIPIIYRLSHDKFKVEQTSLFYLYNFAFIRAMSCTILIVILHTRYFYTKDNVRGKRGTPLRKG